MPSDINHVVLVGRLTRDAELKVTNSGLQICRFGLANNYSRKQGDNWIEETNFFDCFMMGRRAEAVQRYLTKGKQIALSGELRYSRWEQDGQPRSKVEVFVGNIQFLGSSGGGSPGRSSGSQDYTGERSGGHESDQYGSGSDFEDDVPF